MKLKFSSKSRVGRFLLQFIKQEPSCSNDRETLCLTDDGRQLDEGWDIHQDSTELDIRTEDITQHTAFACPKCGGRNRIARGQHAGKCVKCDLNII